jgi:hypothetical protein
MQGAAIRRDGEPKKRSMHAINDRNSMKSNFLVVLVLFVTAMALSARLSLAWPYRENWPYTGLVYGVLFLVLTAIAIITLRKHFLQANFKISTAKIGASFLLYFLVTSAFWSFSLRFLTEPQIAHSFEKATVIEKYRSSNHNGPAFAVQRENGTIIKLDVPGQEEFWQKIAIGSTVRKQFGNERVFLVSEKESKR